MKQLRSYLLNQLIPRKNKHFFTISQNNSVEEKS